MIILILKKYILPKVAMYENKQENTKNENILVQLFALKDILEARISSTDLIDLDALFKD